MQKRFTLRFFWRNSVPTQPIQSASWTVTRIAERNCDKHLPQSASLILQSSPVYSQNSTIHTRFSQTSSPVSSPTKHSTTSAAFHLARVVRLSYSWRRPGSHELAVGARRTPQSLAARVTGTLRRFDNDTRTRYRSELVAGFVGRWHENTLHHRRVMVSDRSSGVSTRWDVRQLRLGSPKSSE
jgi:hypothetical protein